MKKVKTQVKSRVATKNDISVGHKIALSMLVFSAFFVGLNFAGMAFSIEGDLPLGLVKPINKPSAPTPLQIDNLQEAKVNLNISNPDGAHIHFAIATTTLGNLDLGSNDFNPDYFMPITSREPLKLSLTHMEQGNYTFPSRIINIQYHSSSTDSGIGDWGINEISNRNLCLPESQVFPADNNPVSYYYDVNGTPYFDKKLTQMATPKPCNQLLANAFYPNDIFSASANLPVYDVDMPTVYFLSNFEDVGSSRGLLFLNNNQYNPQNSMRLPGAPLAVKLGHMDSQTSIIPSRILRLETGIDTSHTLCLPESSVEPMDVSGGGTYYFYDTNGTPYHDSLLTQMATPKPCNQLLANALNLTRIDGANISTVLASPSMAEITFIHNASARGSLNLNTNYFTGDTWGVDDLNTTINPWGIMLMHGEDQAQNFPTMMINVDSNNTSYRLCVPASLVEANMDTTVPVHYFYDKYGKPYSDSLLIHNIICPPIKPTNFIPSEALPE